MTLRTYRLDAIPKLSPNHFRWDNSCRNAGFQVGANWMKRSTIRCEYPVIGICENLSEKLMMGRQHPQIGILFQTDDGHLWQHFPVNLDREDKINIICELVEG